MGNSRGLSLLHSADELGTLLANVDKRAMMFEQFVPGTDVTIPVYWSNTQARYIVTSAILYEPLNRDANWIYTYDLKTDSKVRIERKIAPIDMEIQNAIIRYAEKIQIQSLARIDFRYRFSSFDKMPEILNYEDLYFIELNTLPTLKKGINFLEAIDDHILAENWDDTQYFKDNISPSIRALSFLLFHSAISFESHAGYRLRPDKKVAR